MFAGKERNQTEEIRKECRRGFKATETKCVKMHGFNIPLPNKEMY